MRAIQIREFGGPEVLDVVPLERVGEGHAALEQRDSTGKLVLVP